MSLIVIKDKKYSVESAFDMASNLLQSGHFEEMARLCQDIIKVEPNHYRAQHGLAIAAYRSGDVDTAYRQFRIALELKPDYFEALNNLGNALREQGHPEQAMESYIKALALQPDSEKVQTNMAYSLSDMGRVEESIELFKRILLARPDHADANFGCGVCLEKLNRPMEAAEFYRRAIDCKPDFVEALFNLGNVLMKTWRYDEAAESLEKALMISPDYFGALMNLGKVYLFQGRVEEATDCYRHAMSCKPDSVDAHTNYIMNLQYHSDVTLEFLSSETLKWDKLHGVKVKRYTQFTNDSDPGRRLRIGYVSGDFRLHPVGFYFLPILYNHDAATFETYCYSNSTTDDSMTKRLRAYAGHWREISGITDAEVCDMIRADEIDILLDLSGHTAGNRLPVFARKPAPVQISWLGYFFTTGLTAMDYLLTDELTVPQGDEQWFSEEVIRLPCSRFCYGPPSYAPKVKRLPALEKGYITFGSFNNLAKVSLGVVDLWSRILSAVPDSRMLLKWESLGGEASRDRITGMFARHGIGKERLDLRGASEHSAMLAEYGEMDIALDPFPFSGGLTSCEALWMGVPVVTFPRERPISRQTAGFLACIGLGDLVARSLDDYASIAVKLAADREGLSDLRHGMREMVRRSPLCDGKGFVSNLESIYRDLWRRYCLANESGKSEMPASRY